MQGDIAVRNFTTKRKATMRNRRLIISALALLVITGCSGEDRGLNPEILGMIGSWDATTLGFTQVAAPNTVVDAFSAGAGAAQVRDQKLYFYDDGKILIITTFIDALAIDPDYEVIDPFEVFMMGENVSTLSYRMRTANDGVALDFEIYAALIADIEAACGNTAGTGSGGGPTAPCNVIVFEIGHASDQEVLTFTRNGDNMTINGVVTYDFGAGDEPATMNLVIERFIPDTPVQPLV
jgi:hypothetical protein